MPAEIPSVWEVVFRRGLLHPCRGATSEEASCFLTCLQVSEIMLLTCSG